MVDEKNIPDICLILEGTYPYVIGGVSSWAHDLILNQSHLTFHIISILPPDQKLIYKYEIPDNVVKIDNIIMHQFDKGAESLPKKESFKFFHEIEQPLLSMLENANLESFKCLINAFKGTSRKIGSDILLNSFDSWKLLMRMYYKTMKNCSFLDYFWSWRTLLGGMYSVLLCDLPEAKSYHALCTGYAGLFLARAKVETGKGCMLTEHGIYTNERRIEIASADWLEDNKAFSLTVETSTNDREIKEFWSDMFASYSQMCYDACDYIITLYAGNRKLQIEEGASPEKTLVIPNGIDYNLYSDIKRDFDHPPTIALIGRVVPIKDVKTFIRAAGLLRDVLPDLKAYIMGPTDEDKDYYNECVALTEHEKLQGCVEFTGKVNIVDYLPKVDVVVLTSISEAQPLVILEAGAAGIPSVATNVGACSEMIYGSDEEFPVLGDGGIVTVLANPKAVAGALTKLFTDRAFYESCSIAVKDRVKLFYSKERLYKRYKKIYTFSIFNNAELGETWQV